MSAGELTGGGNIETEDEPTQKTEDTDPRNQGTAEPEPGTDLIAEQTTGAGGTGFGTEDPQVYDPEASDDPTTERDESVTGTFRNRGTGEGETVADQPEQRADLSDAASNAEDQARKWWEDTSFTTILQTVGVFLTAFALIWALATGGR